VPEWRGLQAFLGVRKQKNLGKCRNISSIMRTKVLSIMRTKAAAVTGD
jgi:hypothetical protein